MAAQKKKKNQKHEPCDESSGKSVHTHTCGGTVKKVAAVTGATGSVSDATDAAAAADGEVSALLGDEGDEGPEEAAAELGDDEEETSRADFLLASAAPPPEDRRPALVRLAPRALIVARVEVFRGLSQKSIVRLPSLN